MNSTPEPARKGVGNKNHGIPIDDLPLVIPVCQWCGKKLKPVVTEDRRSVNGNDRYGDIIKRTFQMWAGVGYVRGVPLFHINECAIAFAKAAHESGFRRP